MTLGLKDRGNYASTMPVGNDIYLLQKPISRDLSFHISSEFFTKFQLNLDKRFLKTDYISMCIYIFEETFKYSWTIVILQIYFYF